MDAEALIGRTLGGTYWLTALLGQGAMGAVYRAAVAGGPDVAVKVMNPGLASGELGARFLREAQALQQIRSSHVVRILGAGQDQEGSLLYLAMPLMVGQDVEHLLRSAGPLKPLTAVRIAVQAAHGLADAHDAGIVHRDVKPSNLFLEELAGGKVMVRVCDFGVAKQAGEGADLTATGSQIGSPQYMSPEQLKSSKHVDARTDIWSLGVTLYEMLCGRTPTEHASGLLELLEAVCEQDSASIQDLANWVEPALASVLHGALRRDLAKRWPNMQRFADLLLQLCGENDALKKIDLVPVPATERSVVAERADLTADPEAYLALPLKTDSDHDHLLGRSLGGRYKVLRELGRGGMGAVFEVEGPGGQRLAAKVMSRTDSRDSIGARRFAREARAASAVDSPHVVRTLEIDADDELGVPFIVMELLSGTDLAALLKREAPLAPEIAVRLFLQAGQGLRAAHQGGIVHRDIKPANLFLQTDAASEQVTVKVCDFGVAKRQAGSYDQSTHELTHTGGMLGSPMYMSPEQARNAKSVDHRCDIWSLSVALWEALGGRRLWGTRSSLGEVILAICSEPIPRLEEVAPWVPRPLADAVHRGLERDPAQRWASIDELLRAIEPFAAGRFDVFRGELKTIDAERRIPLGPPSLKTMVLPGGVVPVELTTMGGASSESGDKPAPSRRGLLAAALVAVVALGGAGWWLSSRAPVSAEPTVAAEASALPVVSLPPAPIVAPVEAATTPPASPAVSVATPSSSQPALRRRAPAATSSAPRAAAVPAATPAATKTDSGGVKPKDDW